MKTKKFSKKLTLNKITVSELTTNNLDAARGGFQETKVTWCTICGCTDVDLSCMNLTACICATGDFCD